jgi:hypothetical protein
MNVNIFFERTAIQEIARDVVQPETLAQVVKQLCSFHLVLSYLPIVTGGSPSFEASK